MASIYTREELITKIKAIDEQLNDPVSMSKTDTGFQEQEFRVAIVSLERQRERLMQELNNLDMTSSGAGIVTLVNKL